jgi:hypothetical protein
MPRSKEKYPERNGERWSYCYQSDPMSCSTHFHVTAMQLAKILDTKKQILKGDEEVISTTVGDLMDRVFVEETEEEYAARKFKYANKISDREGKMFMTVEAPTIAGIVEEKHYELPTGRRDPKTRVVTRDKKIVFEAVLENTAPSEKDFFHKTITKDFDNYREASEWVNDQVSYLQDVRKTYGALVDLACDVEGCSHRGGGPSHFNYKESGSSCHRYPTASPHCTCRACWG